jgi:hypothetical protein
MMHLGKMAGRLEGGCQRELGQKGELDGGWDSYVGSGPATLPAPWYSRRCPDRSSAWNLAIFHRPQGIRKSIYSDSPDTEYMKHKKCDLKKK